MFYAYDSCNAGTSCEYSHDKNNLYKGPKPRGIKSATSAGAASVSAATAAVMFDSLPKSKAEVLKVAATPLVTKAVKGAKACFKKRASLLPRGSMFQRAFTTIMAATAACQSVSMEFLLDSGAGRNLISPSSLPSEMLPLFGEAPEKLKFSTGGGVRSGTKAVKIQGSTSGENVFYSLKDCPPALSLGIQVNEHKRPWIWMPDQLPYFVKADRVEDLTVFCPESAKIYADRVVENVPILNESITCSCLPAGVDPPEPSSSSWEGRPRAAGPEHPPSGDPVEPPGPDPKRPADLRDKKEGGKLRLN